MSDMFSGLFIYVLSYLKEKETICLVFSKSKNTFMVYMINKRQLISRDIHTEYNKKFIPFFYSTLSPKIQKIKIYLQLIHISHTITIQS